MFDTGDGPSPDNCLQKKDLQGFSDGSDTPAPAHVRVTELCEWQHRHKGDQAGDGSIMNIYEDENGSPTCAVALYNRLRSIRPDAFSAERGEEFLFTMSDGSVVTPAPLEKLLKEVAVRMKFKPDGIRLHSLRAGGATALWHAGFDTFTIQGRGKWRSDAFKTYIWDGREKARDVATRMWAARPSLLAAMRHRADTTT